MNRLLKPADLRTTPWKNGGGRTTEIAAHPPGAGLDAFDWRVSIADVAADGPFSPFPGVDRTIVVLEGGGMRLRFADRTVDVRERYLPFSFRGDLAPACALLSGPVRDFNLMLRRDRVRGGVEVVQGRPARIEAAVDRLCFVAAGAARCRLGDSAPLTLAEGDTLWVGGGGDAQAALDVVPLAGHAVVLAVTIDSCR